MSRPKRPLVVTAAALIMGGIALLHLVSAVVSFLAINEATRAFRDLARRERFEAADIDAGINGLRVGLICSGAIMLLFALLLAGLAYGIWRGNRPARIVTWVVCGLGVLCSCCSGFGSTASFSSAGTTTTDRSEVLGNLVIRALPDWASAVLVGSSGLAILGYIATAVLLALPAANAYFKGGTDSGWQPPTYPQPPTHPTYPQPPAHPSHPAPPPSDQ